jgi:hypothetical protein
MVEASVWDFSWNCPGRHFFVTWWEVKGETFGPELLRLWRMKIEGRLGLYIEESILYIKILYSGIYFWPTELLLAREMLNIFYWWINWSWLMSKKPTPWPSCKAVLTCSVELELETRRYYWNLTCVTWVDQEIPKKSLYKTSRSSNLSYFW